MIKSDLDRVLKSIKSQPEDIKVAARNASIITQRIGNVVDSVNEELEEDNQEGVGQVKHPGNDMELETTVDKRQKGENEIIINQNPLTTSSPPSKKKVKELKITMEDNPQLSKAQMRNISMMARSTRNGEYLVSSADKGIFMFKGNKLLKKYLIGQNYVYDIIFMRDNFWISEESMTTVYRKNLSIEDPVVFSADISFFWCGRCLRPFMEERCLMVVGQYKVRVIEVKDDLSKGVQGELKHQNISSVSPLPNKDKFVLITEGNSLVVSQAIIEDDEISFKQLDKIEIKGFNEIEEYGHHLVVSSDSRYVITGQCSKLQHDYYVSNISVYELDADFKLSFKAILDMSDYMLKSFHCFELVMESEDAVFFSGLVEDPDSPLMTFAYHTGNNKVQVLESQRKEFRHGFISKYCQIGEGEFEAIDNNWRLYKFNYEWLH